MERIVEPVESGAHVVLLASPVIMLPLAQSGSAKVKAQYRQPKALKGFHRVVDNLVVHRAAAQRMRMANQRRVSRIRRTGVEQRFQPSFRAAQILNRLDGV